MIFTHKGSFYVVLFKRVALKKVIDRKGARVHAQSCRTSLWGAYMKKVFAHKAVCNVGSWVSWEIDEISIILNNLSLKAKWDGYERHLCKLASETMERGFLLE